MAKALENNIHMSQHTSAYAHERDVHLKPNLASEQWNIFCAVLCSQREHHTRTHQCSEFSDRVNAT